MRDEVLTGEVLPPMPVHRLDLAVDPGMTILAILDREQVPHELREYLHIRLNGVPVLDWAHVMTRPGDEVEILAIPSGGGNGSGKQVLSSIAMLAITLVAPFAAPGIAGAIGLGASKLAVSGITMGISLVGALLVRALIPPPNFGNVGAGSSSTPAAERPSYAFTGQSNETRLYQTVPRIYGRTRFVPPLAATPQIINVGKSSRVSILYDLGIGNVEVSDLRVGALPLSTIDPEIRIHRNTAAPDLDFITRGVAYDQLDYALIQNDPVYLTTNPDSIGATIDINFPSGLVRFLRNGERRMNAVGLRIRYREVGTTAWTILPATRYSGANKNQQALVFTAYYNVADLGEMANVTNAWVTRVDSDDGQGSIQLVRDGRTLFAQENDDFDKIAALTVGGRTYHRGISRDSITEDDGDTRTGYELLVGNPAPNSTVSLSNNTAEPFVVSAALNFPRAGTWEIEVFRATPVSDPALYNSIRDATRIGMIKSWKRGNVLALRKRHTMVEVRYTATDRVSGVIEQFNVIATGVIRDFTSTGFTGTVVASSNPALIAIDILTGEGAKRPLTAAQIDWPSWARFRNYCNEPIATTVNGITTTGPRFRWNGVIETDMTVREAVTAVLSNARATMILTSAGKWGVMIDRENTTPRQLITPRNSWNFSGSRPFVQMPDALRVAFVNAATNWSPADTLVYRDGKNASNTTVIEDVSTMGITSYAEAWRYGRYMMAQGIVRSEQFVVTMDVENLVVQRGDLVWVQHDVPLFGGQAFRVMAVDPVRNGATLDGALDMASGGRYTARKPGGTIVSGVITGMIDETTVRLDDVTNAPVDSLIVLDSGTAPTEPYLVQSIDPMDDLTAQLTLVKYDPQVYTADTGRLPDWEPGFGQDINGKTSVTIEWVGIVWSWVYIEGVPYLRLVIDWRVVTGLATYAGANVEVSRGNEPWVNVSTATDSNSLLTFDVRYDDRPYFDGAVKIRITPFNSLGVTGPSIRRDVRLPTYDATPAPPTNFSLDVRSQEITLFWKGSPSPDVIYYVLKYSPDIIGAEFSTAQALARVNSGEISFTTGARTGTYFIAAENRIGRQSDPLSARTSIEDLPDINVMEVYNPAPLWEGSLNGFTRGKLGAYSYANMLMLDGSVQQTAVPVGWSNDVALLPTGSRTILVDVDIPEDTLVSRTDWGESQAADIQAIYQMDYMIDLGAIYEVRIQSFIKAAAVNAGDFTVDNGEATDSATNGSTDALEYGQDWDAWLEYRTIDELDVIADWLPSLADVPSMAQGSAEFGPWRPIRVGDATGRFFQFRIVAQAEADGTLITITDGSFELDMPDRQWRANNLAVPASGLTVNFTPAFAAPPVIAVTLEGTGAATRYTATDLTRGSVMITLYNAAGTAVSGQIDIAALGYGRERAKGT